MRVGLQVFKWFCVTLMPLYICLLILSIHYFLCCISLVRSLFITLILLYFLYFLILFSKFLDLSLIKWRKYLILFWRIILFTFLCPISPLVCLVVICLLFLPLLITITIRIQILIIVINFSLVIFEPKTIKCWLKIRRRSFSPFN